MHVWAYTQCTVAECEYFRCQSVCGLFGLFVCVCIVLCALLSCTVSSSLQVELPGGGVRRRGHAAAAVSSGSSVQVIEFGGMVGVTNLAATAVMTMSKLML